MHPKAFWLWREEYNKITGLIKKCMHVGHHIMTSQYPEDLKKRWILEAFNKYYHIPNSLTLAAASRLKFSQNDFYTDIDWIFKLNEICISNGKQTNTLTNRIQFMFGEYLF